MNEYRRMGAFLLVAFLALAACGNKDRMGNTQNISADLSPESIVSNDVAAIDAVTGEAANMAADAEMNFGNLDDKSTDAALNEGREKPLKADDAGKVAHHAR